MIKEQGKGEAIFNSLYHFPTFYEYLHISRAITAESSPQHMDSRRSQTRNLY